MINKNISCIFKDCTHANIVGRVGKREEHVSIRPSARNLARGQIEKMSNIESYRWGEVWSFIERSSLHNSSVSVSMKKTGTVVH